MEDLFAYEQNVLDNALLHASESRDRKYDILAKEYGSLLKRLRTVTKTDSSTSTLTNTAKLEMLDKVNCDTLTGIRNRRYMDENLKRIIKSLARSEGLLSVLMIDIDFFNNFCAEYGLAKGEDCLKSIAETIDRLLLRPDDFIARFDGEEFLVVLPGTDKNGACFIADKILEHIRALNIPHKSSDAAKCVTVSIGVTSSEVEQLHNSNDFIEHAVVALRDAKKTGRNKYTFVCFEEGV
jgi:diguanylate cyclase (GGDEF)-like protein